MTQTVPYLEKKIKYIAFKKLQEEWRRLYQLKYGNELLKKLSVKELKDFNFPDELPFDFRNMTVADIFKGTGLQEIIMSRLETLEQEETELILNKLSNLEYLFIKQQ